MTSVDPRLLAGRALADALRDSRACTWRRVGDLTDAQWQVPHQHGVNPIAWELAHLAWFAEFWVLRGPHRRHADGHATAARPPRHAGPDALFDSARLPHAARWSTPLPSRHRLAKMLSNQLDACLAALPNAAAEPALAFAFAFAALPDGTDDADADTALYFYRLALFHEDMHGEAFAWLRSALAYPAPDDLRAPPCAPPAPPGTTADGTVVIAGGEARLGRPADPHGFAFDNELPARLIDLPAFEIDARPVDNVRYARFVEAGGYDDAACWPGDAGRWRASVDRHQPARWRRRAGADWEARWFDRWLPLDPAAPVIHVNAYEAEACCRWESRRPGAPPRRLPHAAEWERAAPHIGWGMCVWEWTADAFAPYPGFVAGPYMEYSAPWFDGRHRELRGGSFATHRRLHGRHYRNFFEPQRDDVFAGFRSVVDGG